ncbi:MAG: hypothetical protein ABI402_16605 [Ferruginibacter sp.]
MSIGYGFNAIKNKIIVENSFRSPKPGFSLFLNGRIEGHLSKNDFVDLTVKGSEAAFGYSFGIAGVFKYTFQTSVEYLQVNVGYNVYFSRWPILRKLFKRSIFLKPKIGIGVGLSTNKSNDYYREFFYNQYYQVSTSRYNFWTLYTAVPERKISYHGILRAGLSINKNNKELFDLILEYNKGLAYVSTMDLKYNLNGITSNIILGTRGSNINLTAGIPITILRKR